MQEGRYRFVEGAYELKKSSAHNIYHELRRMAKASGLDTQQQFELYLHEAFLARLAQSRYRDKFVLKGGMLVATTGIRRATRDADLLALGISNDERLVKQIIREIAVVDLDDGMEFNVGTISSEITRVEAAYQSIRISMDARLGTASLKFKLDVNFGDPVSPKQIEYEPILGKRPFKLLAYPLEMVVAEKVETMMARGETNTRERDFADVYLLIQSGEIDESTLKEALEKTAAHRSRELTPLSESLGSVGDIRQQDWLAFRERTGLAQLPERFADVTDAITDYIDAIVSRKA